MDLNQYIKYLEADISIKNETISDLQDDITRLEGQLVMEKHKQHKVYTEGCLICKEINSACGYATKEGYADFSDSDSSNEKDWKKMVEYYNKSII